MGYKASELGAHTRGPWDLPWKKASDMGSIGCGSKLKVFESASVELDGSIMSP